MRDQMLAVSAHGNAGAAAPDDEGPQRLSLQPGHIFEYPAHMALMLMMPSWVDDGWTWRAYYYDARSHEATTLESKERWEADGTPEAHWDFIHPEDMSYFAAEATAYQQPSKPSSTLERDAATVSHAAWSKTAHEDVLPHRFPKPAEPDTPPKRTARQDAMAESGHPPPREVPCSDAPSTTPPTTTTSRPKRATRRPQKLED